MDQSSPRFAEALLPSNLVVEKVRFSDKLTSYDQDKLQNIIKYYTNYRKNHYDDNIGIAIENQRREEKQKEIHRELQKLKDVRTTEKYMLLKDERCKIYEQIENFEEPLDSLDAAQNETIESLCNLIEIIENKQLQIIDTEGVNIEFLKNNNINVIKVLL